MYQRLLLCGTWVGVMDNLLIGPLTQTAPTNFPRETKKERRIKDHLFIDPEIVLTLTFLLVGLSSDPIEN